jgi:hypothetical protein
MWCPEKKGRRNNWPFKLAPLGHYSSSPIALILLLKRLHRHSEGAPQIWPKVDQQKYVENSKLSILFSSTFLLANPPARHSALSLDSDEALVVHGASKITQRGSIEELLFIRIKSIF